MGLSNAALLAGRHDVTLLEIDPVKVEAINQRRCPIIDQELQDCLANDELQLRATSDPAMAYRGAELVIVATPTDYDAAASYFDTSTVETVISDVLTVNPGVPIAIKSTIPVRFVARVRAEYPGATVFFSPEFLREGSSLFDNLHPARIVVGERGEAGRAFALMMAEAALDEDVPILLTGDTEAEAIKLSANTYLALRVALANQSLSVAGAGTTAVVGVPEYKPMADEDGTVSCLSGRTGVGRCS